MEGINREIVEKKVYEEGKKEYASKGVGNAGLALGIVGTALGSGAMKIEIPNNLLTNLVF